MTDITLGREELATPALIHKFISIVMMTVALVGSVYLLNWAIDERMSKTIVQEPTQITAVLRERQLGCLARNIYYEAGSEPFEGKVAVAMVTLNRTTSGKFPDDICKVVHQKDDKLGLCQFSWYCIKGMTIPPVNKPNYNESMEVAKKVLLEGFRLPGLSEVLYFHGDYINPGWDRKQVAKIGHHIFYK
jgi:spore germination cell wall hydrolase CwlJ-like protein